MTLGVSLIGKCTNQFFFALIHELRDCCLLLGGDNSEKLSMHDVVRAVAISIACCDQNVFVVRNEEVWEWPDEDALRKCHAISIRDSSIHELLEGLECPQLEFLYMDSKGSSVEINVPEKFFIGMRKLKVVDFSRMQLCSLPSSIEHIGRRSCHWKIEESRNPKLFWFWYCKIA